jgi:hypothetical protein
VRRKGRARAWPAGCAERQDALQAPADLEEGKGHPSSSRRSRTDWPPYLSRTKIISGLGREPAERQATYRDLFRVHIDPEMLKAAPASHPIEPGVWRRLFPHTD